MRRRTFELMEYPNGDIANELNELVINIKVWMYDEAAKLRGHRPKPTSEEIDRIHTKILRALMKDCRPMRH